MIASHLKKTKNKKTKTSLSTGDHQNKSATINDCVVICFIYWFCKSYIPGYSLCIV